MNGVVDREALDNAMVDALADAMKAKLARAREKGRGGWENPAECSVRDLWDTLVEHAHKPNLDMVDVANLAGMVWWRLEHVIFDPTVLSEHLSALALPAQAAAPELVKEAQEIAACLPTDARADWRYTNHFELNGSGEYPWLTLADDRTLDDTEYGQRVGAVLDAAAMLPRLVAALPPAQAAADAAGVLRQVALMAEAIQTADRLPEGSEDRRWAFTDYVNVESRLRRENPTRLRALADALEVQG